VMSIREGGRGASAGEGGVQQQTTETTQLEAQRDVKIIEPRSTSLHDIEGML